MTTMLEAALKYARRGFAVFPCGRRAKQPITAHGCKDATTDLEVIRKWWRAEPEANIGLATGAISGVFVLDVDPDHGGAESSATMENTFGILPPTVVSHTGGGGRHLLFRHPAGDWRVRNLVGFYDGLDVRGDGGYILAAPSVHPSGGRYRWSPENFNGLRPADAPEWLLELVGERAERVRATGVLGVTPGGQARPRSDLSARYVAAAPRSACCAIAAAEPGTRNSTLNTEAFGIGQLIGPGVLDLRDAAMALAEAAFECGLRGDEIERTLQSGLRAGIASPRGIMEWLTR